MRMLSLPATLPLVEIIVNFTILPFLAGWEMSELLDRIAKSGLSGP